MRWILRTGVFSVLGACAVVVGGLRSDEEAIVWETDLAKAQAAAVAADKPLLIVFR